MSSDEGDDYGSDEDVDAKQHGRLIQDVLQLDKKQFVKKPSRTEPTTHVSEFDLAKSDSSRRGSVSVKDLAKTLGKNKKHSQLGNKIKSTQQKVSVLCKPLEKPQRDRIKRKVGFEEVKLDLGKWDAIVTKNRVSSQLHFPLNDGQMDIYKNKKAAFQLTVKSDLQKALEEVDAGKQETEEKEEETFPLSLKEVLERRREMARLRAHQSYQEAKAHRQNKIKSKKFHRIKRQEKIKEQIKEFETLQKTDPEAAIRKLDQLDKTRAEERMSLRHRSTGQWAKSKQIRAKYDKQSRQVLAQQLALSRELTHKLKTESSGESDDEISQATVSALDKNNPWFRGVNTQTEIDEFLSGYRKFWDEKNKETNGTNGMTESQIQKENTKPADCAISQEVFEKINDTSSRSEGENDKAGPLSKTQKNQRPTKKRVTRKKNLAKSTSEWEVESTIEDAKKEMDEEDLEEMFEELEEMAQRKFKEKLNRLQANLKKQPDKTKPAVKKRKREKPLGLKSKTKNYLELPREKLRPEIDEALIDSAADDRNAKELRYFSTEGKAAKRPNQETNIDPERFLKTTPTNLDTLLPNDAIIGDDNEEPHAEKALKNIISEAFEGDDVVSEFSKEKTEMIDREKPEDIDMTLPGWGDWVGKNTNVSKRKRRRFTTRFPRKIPRRDENKGQLIINEKRDESLKKHLVSEVPFPFKSVKDFEASVRAPIGDTFVPQTAFRRLIKPAVVTKTGEVITPMDQQVLVNHKFTKNGMVVKN